MTIQLLLDAVITVLLAVFIGYAVLLSRQLRDLRRNRDEMARIITTFNEATARAEAGIPRLRKTAEEAGRALDESVSKARSLRDDLAYMVERADGMAARLESTLRSARGDSKAAPAPAPSVPRPEPRAVETRADSRNSDLRPDLRPDLRGVDLRGGEGRGDLRAPDLRALDRLDVSAAEHDDRLSQARPRGRSLRAEARPALAAPARGGSAALDPAFESDAEGSFEDERSEAERELLRALQAVR